MEEKDFFYIELFELYKSLLTDKQKELFGSHYLYDLSLSEIAETEGTTRQSVYDAVKKVKNKLEDYEKSLKLKEKYDALKKIASELKTKDEKLSESILELIGK